jgi:hypothetical protein
VFGVWCLAKSIIQATRHTKHETPNTKPNTLTGNITGSIIEFILGILGVVKKNQKSTGQILGFYCLVFAVWYFVFGIT